jgi:hypothetical protein
MSDTTFSTSPPVDPGALTSAAALKRAAFNAILQGRRLSRAELIEATGAAPEDVDELVGRALVLDADDHIVAAHGAISGAGPTASPDHARAPRLGLVRHRRGRYPGRPG